MTKTDFVGQFLVGASTALATAIINLVLPGKISWFWLIPAFVVPFTALFLYQGLGPALGFRLHKAWKIRTGELVATDGTQKGDIWEFQPVAKKVPEFYGPCIALPKGKYRAVFRFKIDSRDERDEPICDVGVTSNSGQKWFGHQTISIRDFRQSDEWQDFPLDFNMINDESKVEFRARMADLEKFQRRIMFDKVIVYKRLLPR